MHQEWREHFPATDFKGSRVRYARVMMHVGIAIPWWRGKRFRHSWRKHKLQFYVSGKRPIGRVVIKLARCGYRNGHRNLFHGSMITLIMYVPLLIVSGYQENDLRWHVEQQTGWGPTGFRDQLRMRGQLHSSTAKMPAKFQSDWKSVNLNLATTRLQEILQWLRRLSA